MVDILQRHVSLPSELANGVYAANCQSCGFFFKFRAVEPTASTVTFTVNGTSYTVGNEFDPATSLNEWLRSTGVSRGTKQMCIEGGCGVCLVSAKLYDPISDSMQVYAINSCLAQLYMCDGWEITTIEGLGSPDTQLHPIQQRLAQYNGSQCGYCSPAQVMNMYGFLQRNNKPTKQEIEDNYDATICRCTGYRPILDAMKSFAADAPPSQLSGPVDIEDLTPRLCKKSGQPCRRGRHGSSARQRPLAEKDKGARGRVGRPLHIVGAAAQWFKPTTLPELYQLLKQHQNDNYRLVFGNTGFGVYKDIGPWLYDILIDIRGITALFGVYLDQSIILGANLSLGNLIELFERSDPSAQSYFPVLADHLKKVATNTVRSLACWAGSLMLKHQHPEFISDVYTMFETVGVQLFVVDSDAREMKVTLTDFLKMDMKGKVIISAEFPKYSSEDKNIHINTYRVSQRLQNAHAYVTAGFNFRLDPSQNYAITQRPTMVFQGISATLFVLSIMPDKVAQRYQSGATQLVRPVSSGVQTFDTNKAEWPLNEPMPKLDAEYQILCSGQVQYAGQPIAIIVAEAIRESARRVTGTLETGIQYHFHMETQTTRCVPSDDGGMDVQSATQSACQTAMIVAGVLGIPQSSVTVEVKRVGGAFGAKSSRSYIVAGACAWAAGVMGRPVRMKLDLHTNMKSIGKRPGFLAQYEVGCTEEGQLNGLRVTVYADCGFSDQDVAPIIGGLDNVVLPAAVIMESIMDHVAKYLNKDPTDVRKLNLYQKGQANRWKKRGLSMVPVRYHIGIEHQHFSVLVSIYHMDGTIAIQHGGIEMGQGINTKTFKLQVAQVCAYELGVPLSLIRVKRNTTIANANSKGSNASTASGLNCMGVIQCCQILKSRMDPIRQKMDKPTWQQLVAECYAENVDLTVQAYLSPDVDIGQMEGAFMIGVGYLLSEKMKYDSTTGAVLTDGTWQT
nr:hypothetical protein BaRGS_001852 [Batillaria attramentaria]